MMKLSFWAWVAALVWFVFSAVSGYLAGSILFLFDAIIASSLLAVVIIKLVNTNESN